MKKVFLLAISAAFTFTACKDTKAEATTTDVAPTETNAVQEDHTGHDHAAEATETTPNQATSVNNSKEVKLNPPHGEQGHRCEIPVGAPLDGSASPAQQQVQAQPASSGQGFLGGGNAQPPATPAQAMQQAPPAQQTAPGMQGKPNPAHGQPGHRCDVQVGQPLP